jgi:phosphatidylglycerophosphate synthase
MSKLAAEDKFFDLSDYGRTLGKLFANQLKHTRFTPIHVTLLFGASGLVAIYCIVQQCYYWAAFFIVLKSIIDAADGELARLKNTPSYVGRYLDSCFDIVLNFLFLITIGNVCNAPLWLTLAAFVSIQLQGTLYNYYYVILRHASAGGDVTSKVFEHQAPIALHGESQQAVNILFAIYTIVYGGFDKVIHLLDADAYKAKTFPNWFMTLVSMYGLGFQLLIIAVLLPLGGIAYILPFFVAYNVFIPVLIVVRKVMLRVG